MMPIMSLVISLMSCFFAVMYMLYLNFGGIYIAALFVIAAPIQILIVFIPLAFGIQSIWVMTQTSKMMKKASCAKGPLELEGPVILKKLQNYIAMVGGISKVSCEGFLQYLAIVHGDKRFGVGVNQSTYRPLAFVTRRCAERLFNDAVEKAIDAMVRCYFSFNFTLVLNDQLKCQIDESKDTQSIKNRELLVPGVSI